jgi:colanic acid/amylovoran biosynthesis glycosyltransferase
MKILFIVGQFPKLSETFILNQITGLIDQGNEVTILAEKPKLKEEVHEDINKYNLLDKIVYYDYPLDKKNRLLKAINCFLKNPILALKSINIAKYGKEVLSLKHLFLIRKISSLDKVFDFDVIHCHFGPNGILAGILRDLNLIKGRILTTFHGHDMTAYLKGRGDNVYNFLFQKGDLFLPISHYWKNKLISLGCNPNKIIVHPMGVDLEKFTACQYSSFTNEIKILSIARLVEKKGIKYGIQAISKLVDDGYNIQYNIVGDGPLLKDLKKKAGKKLGENINFLGWKTQEEMLDLIMETDLLLAPSAISQDGDMEGIPVVLMESMAMQKIVVSTYHSGIPELVNDMKNGFLVNEKDSNELFSKLKYIIDNNSHLSNIGVAARNTIDEKHNIIKLNNKLEEIMK